MGKRREKMTWGKVMRKDMIIKDVTRKIDPNMVEHHKKIHVADPN